MLRGRRRVGGRLATCAADAADRQMLKKQRIADQIEISAKVELRAFKRIVLVDVEFILLCSFMKLTRIDATLKAAQLRRKNIAAARSTNLGYVVIE